MLRFVVENKEKKGEKNRARTFWIYALGEFGLVFLGILVALQVDNWNRDRQERKLEKVLLRELLMNLERDLSDVDSNILIHRNLVTSSGIALDFIDGNEPWHDSLAIHFGRLKSSSVFFENISAYESLKSLGIDLIRNDSLRQHLTHLYSVAYGLISTMEDRGITLALETMNTSFGEHLYQDADTGNAVPLDLSELRKSNTLRNDLILCRQINVFQLSIYESTKTEIQNLIEEIEKELEK